MKNKPVQKIVTHNNDAADCLEAISDAISSLHDAMDAIRGYGEFEQFFLALDDLVDDMARDRETYEAAEQAEYRAEIEGLTRDYWRAVI